MKLERVKNTKQNIKFGLINRIIMLFLPFVLRTVFIRKLGIEYAGVNSLLTSILQMINLAELGFSNAVVYSMYKPIAENNEEEICALLSFYKKIYLRIGILIFVIGICIMPMLPIFTNADLPLGLNIYVAFLLLLIDTSLSYLMYSYKNSLLIAYQRDDIIYKVSLVIKGIMYFVQIAVILFLQNYYCYLIVMVIFTIINNVVINIEVNKLFPDIKSKGILNDEAKKNIKKNVAGVFVTKICQVSRNACDSIFISAFLGVAMAGMYSNYYYISSTLAGLLSVAATSMLAGIGNSMQLDSANKNYEDFKQFDYLYMWISGFCGVCLMCLYQPFMSAWVGKKYMLSTLTVMLFCVYFYVLRMGDIRGIYMQAAGFWQEKKNYAITEAICNLILNFIFVQLWNLNGIIVATLIPLFLINFLGTSPIIFNCYFHQSVVKYYFFHLKSFLSWSLIGVLTYSMCQKCNHSNLIINILIKMTICIVVSNFIFIIINWRDEKLRKTYLFMKQILG